MKILRLVFSLLLPLLAGGVAGIFTASAIPEWYSTLHPPSFNPPNQVFGPVWTLLYLLMGISCYRIWILPPSAARQQALLIYFLQLTLNFFWSFIFFYFRALGWALLEIIVLWITIVLMIRAFYPLDQRAALLQIPYLLWVTFATVLNAAYVWLNGW